MPASTTPQGPPASDFTPGMPLVGGSGLEGEIEQAVDDLVIVRLRDGARILMRPVMLRIDADGTARTDVSRGDIDEARARRITPETNGGSDSAGMVIPLLEERVRVDTEAVETGRVRVVKRVHTEEHEVEQPVTRQQVNVERVEVGTAVEDPANPPQARTEGGTLIIPLLEEVLVVEKRLVVREELRITRQTQKETARQPVTLRKEEAEVQRLQPEH